MIFCFMFPPKCTNTTSRELADARSSRMDSAIPNRPEPDAGVPFKVSHIRETPEAPGAPLRTIRGFARQGSAFSLRVHSIAVSPVLMHASPWIAPIVEDLCAKEMTSHAPH